MSLLQLTPEWRAWLHENVTRGCTAASLHELLVKGGHSQGVAREALRETCALGWERLQASTAAWQQGLALSAHAGVVQAPAETAAFAAQPALRPHVNQNANRLQASDGQTVRIAAVLDQPQVVLFENMLSADECLALMALAESRLSRSTVVDEQQGEARQDEARSSAGAWFQRGETPLIARIEARLAELLHWPVDHGEGLQVLRYAIGGEYRAHYDYFNPDLPGSQRHLQTGGQRVGTCLLYLDEVTAGGGTRFPKIGFEVRPSRGAALYFADVTAAGLEDADTLHAGLPVVEGIKYIATKWLRQRPYG
ncbi:2OG-Fe(II) oxygenase [Roseateles koreensis]|uniref:2OG-Fe(II) oxygenase n=1 Tax=Roseateles koreensis TaxID=2987526 RepID=A0ABT5KQX4_9BURK|nr:2OG-Fe(II) oxygenase [Roseateles koreensis]MDC8784865.1 2OG-Fe(II) oxygenase [Roseateles koreensis]